MKKRSGAYNEKHYARAVDALAHHRCSTDLTDGFCGPRDGACAREGRLSRGARARGGCIAAAEGLLAALASRGMMVVWVYDKELPPELRGLAERFDAHAAD